MALNGVCVVGRRLPACLAANHWSTKLVLWSTVSCRSITYEVLPSGEKIVISKREGTTSKKEKWQNVRPMGYEPELRMIKKLEMDERRESDPRMARRTAESKLQSLKDSLRNRGFCRETKPYEPPKDVTDKVTTLCGQLFPNQDIRSEKLANISLSDPMVKFNLLTKCNDTFSHEVPNSSLYLMRTVADVLEFYSTPIRGITSYDLMAQQSDHLPPNLHVIPEPIRFNPESDTYFGGISAYPFADQRVKGLRARKKFPEIKGHFKWPDV